MHRSARGWSVRRFERSKGLDTALYETIPLPFFKLLVWESMSRMLKDLVYLQEPKASGEGRNLPHYICVQWPQAQHRKQRGMYKHLSLCHVLPLDNITLHHRVPILPRFCHTGRRLVLFHITSNVISVSSFCCPSLLSLYIHNCMRLTASAGIVLYHLNCYFYSFEYSLSLLTPFIHAPTFNRNTWYCFVTPRYFHVI